MGHRLEGRAQDPPETTLAFFLCHPVRFYCSPVIWGPGAALRETGLFQNDQWEAQCPVAALGPPLCEQTVSLSSEAASAAGWPGRAGSAVALKKKGTEDSATGGGEGPRAHLGLLPQSPQVVVPLTDD